MASYNYTFQSGDGVTPTRLNDARTVSNIVNGDISNTAAISLSKLGSGALPSGISVSTTNLVNGTIVDADISATAAIAGTKIGTDFGAQDIETTGNVTLGKYLVMESDEAEMQLKASNDILPPFIFGYRRRGTPASPTAVQENDSVFAIMALARSGTGDDAVGRIDFTAAGPVSQGVAPGAITLSTANLTGTGPAARMQIKPSGQVWFVPLASDPAGAAAGDVYYNSSSNKLKVYNGTSWVDLH